jgi:hypothetical protein
MTRNIALDEPDITRERRSPGTKDADQILAKLNGASTAAATR